MATHQERYIAMLEGKQIPAFTSQQNNDGIPTIHRPPQAYIDNRALLSKFMEENGLSVVDIMSALSEVE